MEAFDWLTCQTKRDMLLNVPSRIYSQNWLPTIKIKISLSSAKWVDNSSIIARIETLCMFTPNFCNDNFLKTKKSRDEIPGAIKANQN